LNAPYDRLAAALDGRYRIDREVGAGGMATVFLAEDLKHHRMVAIKVLREDLAAVVGASRFLREIEIAARLQHPNILPLLDSGEANGLLYYVMPFVEGRSLRQRLEGEGPLPVAEVVRILVEVTDALAYAHAQGVVHRDIKPDNVMLSGRHALVTDFGVARAVSAATSGHAVTSVGIALGTPAYMSPEQAAADPLLDHRADLYAVGVLGYELLAGRPPFVGGSPQQVLADQIAARPEPIGTRRSGLAPALEHVLMKCLEKRPEDRWQGGEELLAQLEALATPSGGTTPLQRKRRIAMARPRVWAIGTLGVALGAAMLWRGTPPLLRMLKPSAPAFVIGQSTQFTRDDGLELFPSISPDGKFIAYAAGDYARLRIFIRPVTGGRTIALSDDTTGIETQPRWSPDGNQVLFLSRGAAWIAPTLGGAARRITPVTESGDSVASAAWSPDGRDIAIARHDSLLLQSVSDGAPRLLAVSEDLHSCDWSPDGKRIACVSGNRNYVQPGPAFGNLAPTALVVVSVPDGRTTVVTDRASFHGSPAWAADSHRLYFVSDQQGTRDLYVLEISADASPRGISARLTTGLGVQSFALSADERRLVYSVYAARANLYALSIPAGTPVSATTARALTSGSQIVEGMRASADGQWVVFDSNLHGNFDIYRIPVSGGNAEALTSDPADEFQADLSPDGKDIAYHSWKTGSRDIFVKPLAGGPVQQLTSSPAQEAGPVWAPDGRSIAFWTIGGTRRLSVVRRNASGTWGAPVERASFLNSRPEWLPDGRSVSFTRNGAIEIVPADSGPPRTLYAPLRATDPQADWLQWRRDGSVCYFKSHDDRGRASIWSIAAAGGRPRLLVRFDDLAHPSTRADFAADAQRLYFALDDRQSDLWVAEIAKR